MKKIGLALMLLIVTVGGLLFSLRHSLGAIKVNASNRFDHISGDNAAKMMEARKDAIIYCAQETCNACRSFTPALESIADELDTRILYLDIDNIANQREMEKYGIISTPTLINIRNGKLYIYRGTMSKEKIRAAITEPTYKTLDIQGILPMEYDELCSLEETPEDFILYIGRDDCGDCQKLHPYLLNYLEENYAGVVHLDIKEIRLAAKADKATAKDIQLFDEIMERYNVTWVPTLIHVQNGNYMSRFEFLDKGYYDLDDKEKVIYEEECVRNLYEWLDQEQ